MKKLIVLFAAIAFSFGMYAQDGKTQTMPVKDHYMMQDGKMWIMRDGKTTAMTEDMTLANGTVVTTSGKVTMKAGQSQMLKNGEAVDLDGVITSHDSSKKDKPKMK